MLLDRLLAVVVDDKNVVAPKLLVDDTGQYRFIVRQKLHFAFLLGGEQVRLRRVGVGLVLLAYDFDQSCNVDVELLAGRHVNKCLHVMRLSGVFANQFELHQDDIVFDVLEKQGFFLLVVSEILLA